MYCLRLPSQSRFADFLQQDMRLAIEHLVALQDRGLPNGLRQMAFACAARPEKQRIFAAIDERSGCQIKDHTAIQFRIES